MGRNKSDLIVFVGKRLVQLLPVVLGVIVITFFFTHVAVQNPCAIWAGPHATQDQIQACIVRFGLDRPLPEQFWRYMANLLSGDWGASPRGVPVLLSISSAFPATLELVLAALLIMVAIGIPLGVVAANGAGRWADHLVRTFYLSGWATPTYLGGVVLAIAIGPALGLPTKGDFTSTPPFNGPTHMSVLDALLHLNFAAAGDAVLHLILPASALAFLNLGIATRMTRTSMLEVLPLDFVKTARMKGLSEFLVLYKHALRNSLISTTTILGITAGVLLSGTVVIENIFQWPGIGAYAFDGITGDNFNGTIAVVILFPIVLGHPVLFTPYDPNGLSTAYGQAPSGSHWLGTDNLGRDMFSRILAALPLDLAIGFGIAGFALLVGSGLGLVAGYWDNPRTFGGVVSVIIMRVTDIFLAFPSLVLALAIAASLGRGTVPSMLAVLLTWWPYYVRLTRGEVLAIKHQPYVVAARAAGTSETRILFRHVLRNLIEPLLVYYTLDIGTVIVTFSTISFVGIGVPLDVPEWGTMVESYERFLLTLPWTVLSAGAAIFVTVLAFSLFGDGLRDILDPRSRRALVQAAIPSTLPAKAFVAAEA